MYTQSHNKKILPFLCEYIKMKMQTQERIVSKQNMKNLMKSLLPMVKKMVNKKIDQIKLVLWGK